MKRKCNHDYKHTGKERYAGNITYSVMRCTKCREMILVRKKVKK